MQVLLTGGTGLIGQALTKALVDQGDEVTILTRRPRPAAGPITYAVWNGKEMPASLQPDAFQAVVHLAGASIAGQRWTAAYKEVLWHSRVDSTEALATWLAKANTPPRFISASAVGYYGHTFSQTPCTEESPPGEDFLAGLARAWEAAALKAPIAPFIARFGVVLAREGGALPKLLQGFQLGIGTYFAPGVQGFSWIHIRDVVKVLLWAIAHPAVSGPHNVCAPHPVSARQLSEALRQCKRAFLLLPIPKGPLYWLYGDLADTLHKGQYAVPERLSKAGFAFTFPTIEAALADLVGSR